MTTRVNRGKPKLMVKTVTNWLVFLLLVMHFTSKGGPKFDLFRKITFVSNNENFQQRKFYLNFWLINFIRLEIIIKLVRGVNPSIIITDKTKIYISATFLIILNCILNDKIF